VAIYEFKGMVPALGRDTWVADTASVIGDVVLGAQANVWFGAAVRGDYMPIRVGARTNIQDNAVVHITHETAKTTIGDDVTVGHGAIVHGATVGNLCLIGMGAILLNNAVVGEGSIIAAGALVTENTVIPPRSLYMGVPAKFKKHLSDPDRIFIDMHAAHYLDYKEIYLKG